MYVPYIGLHEETAKRCFRDWTFAYFSGGFIPHLFGDWTFAYFSGGFIPHLFGDFADISKWKSDDMKA